MRRTVPTPRIGKGRQCEPGEHAALKLCRLASNTCFKHISNATTIFGLISINAIAISIVFSQSWVHETVSVAFARDRHKRFFRVD